jgi:23S rRNA (guanosine2251-2'-O)-methyltransferase
MPKEDLYAADWPIASAWVLGAEAEGLRRLTRETCDQLVSIPMLGSVASLNVSVATGVCLYEARRRRARRPGREPACGRGFRRPPDAGRRT